MMNSNGDSNIQGHPNAAALRKKYPVRKEYSEVEINRLKELILIFRRSSEFLSLQDSLKLLCLNKYIREHISNSEWELIISVESCSEFLKKNYDTNLMSSLQELDINYHNLYSNFLISENLLKNPCGEQAFNHWQRTGNWRFSKKGTWKNKKRCFCTSYNWSTLWQVIDLEDNESNKILLAKSYVARRFDCDSTAQIIILGYESDNWSTIFDTDHFQPPFGDIVSSPSCAWMIINTAKILKPGVTKIMVILAGKDNKAWAGYYGPRFGYTDIRIIKI